MSTTYKGSDVKNTASGATVTWRAKMVYTETVNDTTVSIRCQCYMNVNSGNAPWFNKNRVTASLTIAGNTVKSYSGPSSDQTTFKNDVLLIDYSTSYSRTTADQNKACSFKITVSSYSSWKGTSTATKTGGISVPALSHYIISYDKVDARATGEVISTTKYFNIDTPLADGGFELDGYTLINWNKKSDGTGISYELGQTFTENLTEPITLYAQWLQNYISPVIDDDTLSVYRVNSDGTASEEGERIAVTFNYTGGGAQTAGQETPTIQININNNPCSITQQPTSATGSFNQIFGLDGDYPNNESHLVEIIILNTYNQVVYSNTYTYTVSSAIYPIDLIAHDNYALSTDTNVNASKIYYTRSISEPYIYTEVTNPIGNPSVENYYEFTHTSVHMGVMTSAVIGQTLKIFVDAIYPIGSYYETSDTTFDPNTYFGGIWVLEEEGQVHISAGANYTITGALTDTTDGGEINHTLTVDEMPSHGHKVHVWDDAGTKANAWYYDGATKTTHSGARVYAGSSSTWYASGTTANAAGNGQGDASGTTVLVGGGATHNNMQPYIIVNRWHRIA